MNLEEFLAAVENAPSEPLEEREKLALGRMLFSDLFLRACKDLAGQAVNATGQFTRLDLNTPEGVAKGKDLQLSVKSTFFVLETLIMQAQTEKKEEKE
jgi:hypothetical protein